MSDSFGGNLQSDMPGIDTAPPTTGVARSPLKMPSALQGLAQLFQGQQQPKPAQKFPPVKPPVLTEEQARQPPQHTGTPASHAPVPPTVPVPAGGWSPYIKVQDARDPSQWGDEVRYPRLPATFELGGMFHQIGQTLAQLGGDVGESGGQLAYHSAAYWEAFNKQQDHKMKMALEGEALHSKQAAERLTARLGDYKLTFAEYRAAGGENSLVNGVDLRHALMDDAIKNDDTGAQALLTSGAPLKQVEAYLAEADKVLRDLRAARTKAGDQEAEDAAKYGLGPLAGGGENADFNANARSEGDNPDQTAPAPSDTAPPDSFSADTPDQGKKKPQNAADTPDWAKDQNPVVVDATYQHFKGDPSPKENKYIAQKAEENRALMDTAVNKVLDDAHAGRIKPEEVMPAIRKIVGPGIADRFQAVADYTEPGYGSGAGGGSGGSQRGRDFAQLADEIARAANPGDKDGIGGFVATHYKEQQDFIQNNQIRTLQSRINTLPFEADEIKNDVFALRKLHKYSMKDINWRGIFEGAVANDPAFDKLRADMLAYSTSYQTVINNGRATLGGTRDVEKTFKEQSPLSTYLYVIKGHMGGVRGAIEGVRDDWVSRGGKPTNVPRLSRETEKRIDDYRLMDPNSTARPYDPKNPDNDYVHKKAGAWGPEGDYYWTGKDQIDPDNPKNWKPVQ